MNMADNIMCHGDLHLYLASYSVNLAVHDFYCFIPS